MAFHHLHFLVLFLALPQAAVVLVNPRLMNLRNFLRSLRFLETNHKLCIRSEVCSIKFRLPQSIFIKHKTIDTPYILTLYEASIVLCFIACSINIQAHFICFMFNVEKKNCSLNVGDNVLYEWMFVHYHMILKLDFWTLK